jgi:hypothetical protein
MASNSTSRVYTPLTGTEERMSSKLSSLFLSALLLCVAGCQKGKNYGNTTQGTAPAGTMDLMVAYASTGRFIAEHHTLEVIATESQLQKSWESAVQFCGTIRCEVFSSREVTGAGTGGPSGEITLRVEPQDLQKLLGYVESLGKIAQHTTQREDQTDAVIDAEARIKNLTSFRDSLRAMLAKPSASVASVVEVQKQLTDTQAELDIETQKRKTLANETEKIAVEIAFYVETRSGNNVGMAQIYRTLSDSGVVLADSASSLISTVVFLLPWAIVLLPIFWLLRKIWRRRRLRREAKFA